jgi:hypothetical protein
VNRSATDIKLKREVSLFEGGVQNERQLPQVMDSVPFGTRLVASEDDEINEGGFRLSFSQWPDVRHYFGSGYAARAQVRHCGKPN